VHTVSLLSRTTVAEAAAATPAFAALPKPRFSEKEITWTPGQRRRRRSLVPSVDALSTTITSCARVCSSSEGSNSSRWRRP
jgi:hypothetical protein